MYLSDFAQLTPYLIAAMIGGLVIPPVLEAIPARFRNTAHKVIAVAALVLCFLVKAGFCHALTLGEFLGFGPSPETIRAQNDGENERLRTILEAQERAELLENRGCGFADAFSPRGDAIEDRINERVSYDRLAGRYDRLKSAYMGLMSETDRQKRVIAGLASDELLFRRLSCVLAAVFLFASGWALLVIRDRRRDRVIWSGYLRNIGVHEPERVIDAIYLDHGRTDYPVAVRGVRYGR